jgi:hypothetical protein
LPRFVRLGSEVLHSIEIAIPRLLAQPIAMGHSSQDRVAGWYVHDRAYRLVPATSVSLDSRKVEIIAHRSSPAVMSRGSVCLNATMRLMPGVVILEEGAGSQFGRLG